MKKNLKILLIISGGIAAYKSLELIRILKRNDIRVQVVLTKGGAEFVTPLSVAALSGEKVCQELFFRELSIHRIAVVPTLSDKEEFLLYSIPQKFFNFFILIWR